MSTVARHRLLSLLLATALVATLTAWLTEGQRAAAVDGPVDVVYVATGRNFPDALAGSTLATTVGAPLLTVERDLPLPGATVTALEALDPDRIVVFGGPAAISAEVFEALSAYARSGAVERLAGDDRHATAGAIADALPDPAPIDADTLDGLDSDAFVRQAADAPPETRLAGCGPDDMQGQLERTTRVATTTNQYLELATGQSLAFLSCTIFLPEGATVRRLGYDAYDASSEAWVLCQYLRVQDRSQVPPTLLGQYDPDLTSTDSYLSTGVGDTPGDVRMMAELNDGPVTTGALTQVQLSCYLRGTGGDTTARLYGYVVEYTMPPHAHE